MGTNLVKPRERLLENVAAARAGVEAAEAELDKVINAVQVSPRVEKQLVSEAVANALTTLRAARTKLVETTEILAAAADET